jgi:hypothetical protein
LGDELWQEEKCGFGKLYVIGGTTTSDFIQEHFVEYSTLSFWIVIL